MIPLAWWLPLRPELCCDPHEIGKGSSLHLTHYPASMRLDSDLADSKVSADLLVQPAGNDQIHYLPLTSAERIITVTQRARFGFRGKRDFAVLDRLGDCVQQRVSVERFEQELDGAGLHRLDGHGHVGMAGDEYDRHLRRGLRRSVAAAPDR